MLDKNKFIDKFHPSWWRKLEPFILSKDCYNIYQELKKSNKTIYPLSKDLWKAFFSCNYDSLKAVIIGQSPYHTHENNVPYADGIAFSCSHVNKISPSLSVLYEAIEEDLGVKIKHSPDLSYLSKQDILMLNLSLTIEKGDKDSFSAHRDLWCTFIEFLFKDVLSINTGIPFIIFGSPAKDDISPYLTDNHLVRYVKHPLYYARNKIKMEHNNCFSWASDICMENNGEKIYWCQEDFLNNYLPF